MWQKKNRSTWSKSILGGAVIAAILGAAGCSDDKKDSSPHIENKDRPNLIYIMADDLGYSDLGAFGGEISTPNLDTLAAEGRLVTDFHTAALCAPTRSQLISGTDHHLVGLGAQSPRPHQRGNPGYEGVLNDKALSMPQLLKDGGYSTYMAGKWHLGATEELSPKARGFDRSYALLQGFDLHFGTNPEAITKRPGSYREDGVEAVFPAEAYSTTYYTDKLIEYIGDGRKEGKPLFIYAAYTSPHWPLQAPAEYIDRYKGRYNAGYEAIREQRFARQKALGILPADFVANPLVESSDQFPLWAELSEEERAKEIRRMEVYAAMVEHLDSQIGRLIRHLKHIGEYDNSLIIFTGDNGAEGTIRPASGYDKSLAAIGTDQSYESQGPRWAEVSATPFRLWKGTAAEGGVVAPAIVRLPKQTSPKVHYHGFTSVIDILPTFLEAAGIKNPGSTYNSKPVHPITGLSWWQVLNDKARSVYPAEFVYADELSGNSYVRKGSWKLLYQTSPLGSAQWELYDLSVDRAEINNLADDYPEKVSELRGLFDDYATRVGLIPFIEGAPH